MTAHRRLGWSYSELLRAPLPKADIETLRVFVEWRRQGTLYGVGIEELGRRAGYNEKRIRRFLAGKPMHHRGMVAHDLATALGLIPLKDNEGGYPRGTGYA